MSSKFTYLCDCWCCSLILVKMFRWAMYGMHLCKIVMLVRRTICMVSLNDDYLNGRNLTSLFEI